MQSAFNAQGAESLLLNRLTFVIVGICFIVWLLVVIVMFVALLRRRAGEPMQDEAQDRRLTWAFSSALGVTIVIIVGFTIASYLTTRAIGEGSDAGLTIDVHGRQWWWQFAYADADPSKSFVTANELHIPVGRTVRLTLESDDVVHSFWVPSLAGKQDLVPGRQNIITIRATTTGVFRGQCAEFCGLQHSHMSFFVIVDDEPTFARWRQDQLQRALEPLTPEAIAGKAAFMSKPCAACHTVRGTEAGGKTGPDLTHVGSRRTIAAGVFDTTRGSLAAWIADPQTIKPGNNMPLVPLTSDELRQISAYMESLK